MNKLNLFPKLVITIGIVFGIAGVAATGAGIFIQSFVVDQLVAQNITTPDDATIPNALVNDIPTALSMSEVIQRHAANYTGGLTYAEMGRWAVEGGDPAGTSNRDLALVDESGNLVPNAARNTQLTASGLVTSLSLSAMAIGLSYGVIALGIAFLVLGFVVVGLGYALLGLITPEVAKRYGFDAVAVPA